MEQTQSHSLGIIPISISRLLERLAFYGMRSILVLYVMNELVFEQEKAMSVYAFFGILTGLLPLLGGLLGDFVMNTRTTAIIGGFVQAAGCFVLAIPSEAALLRGTLFNFSRSWFVFTESCFNLRRPLPITHRKVRCRDGDPLHLCKHRGRVGSIYN